MNPTLERSDMRYWRLEPDARLRPAVLCYYVALPAPRSTAVPPQCEAELLLPDGYSEIVFSLANRFERWPVSEDAPHQNVSSSYIIGGRSHSVLTHALGDLCIIGVKLESHALRGLIQTPLSSFRDATLCLRDLNDRSLLDLEDALANAHCIDQIAVLLNAFFLERRSILCSCDRLVTHLISHIRVEEGDVSILRWIHEHGVDPRYFERRFCAWTGMTPKRFARIVRFNHSYRRWLHGESTRGAIGLHLEDYYDQSHFYKDFKYFMGVPPSTKLNNKMSQGTDITEHLMEVTTSRSDVTR